MRSFKAPLSASQGMREFLQAQIEVATEPLVRAVREQVGPVASFKDVDVVPALPKTRSGKILRGTMRAIADGEDPPMPSTIEDPAVLELLRGILRPAP